MYRLFPDRLADSDPAFLAYGQDIEPRQSSGEFRLKP